MAHPTTPAQCNAVSGETQPFVSDSLHMLHLPLLVATLLLLLCVCPTMPAVSSAPVCTCRFQHVYAGNAAHLELMVAGRLLGDSATVRGETFFAYVEVPPPPPPPPLPQPPHHAAPMCRHLV